MFPTDPRTSLNPLQSFNPLHALTQALARGPAVLVTVAATRGSVPREVGAWMAVLADQQIGTVGGGRLELDASRLAQELLGAAPPNAENTTSHNNTNTHASAPLLRRFALGPSLGQCCGGEVQLRFERVGAQDAAALAQRLQPARWPVALFGGGHVGQALVRVLSTLPCALTWVDSRDSVIEGAWAQAWESTLPAQLRCEHSDPVQAAVADVAPGSRVVVMSFSHAEDLDIVAACLLRQRQRGDLPYIGLIGSATKWATFQRRLREHGFSAEELAHVTCPIGVPVQPNKRPEVIAIAVAAQLLQVPPL